MILKIFTRNNCPKCPPAKKLGRDLENKSQVRIQIEWFDVDKIEGMAEGAFYQVMATPTMILVDDKGKIAAEWRGKVPKESAILDKL
ncbi:MAG: thioredoxin family protein [Candidatus Pacebacteria bacterium]|nr:thioredoxin family protein [Candidatus Paceibacterota bacterium]